MAIFRSMAQPCYLCNPAIPVLYFNSLRGSTCIALLWMSFGHYLKLNFNFAVICRWEAHVCLAGNQKMPYFQESMRFKALMSLKLMLLQLTFLVMFWHSFSFSSSEIGPLVLVIGCHPASSFMSVLLSHSSMLMALEIQHCRTMAIRNFEYLHCSKTKELHSLIILLAKIQANTTPALRQWSYKARNKSRLRSNDRIQRTIVLSNIWN